MGTTTSDDRSHLSRRRFLGAATVAAGATAWAAPAILSVDAAAAATVPPATGQVCGGVTSCGNLPDAGDTWLVTAIGPITASDTTDSQGGYCILNLPDGLYNFTLTPNGANTGNPVQPTDSGSALPSANITGGGAIFGHDLDYDANGC